MRLRTFLMWLLMAALPVQSWAIVSMVNCGPTHHRMAQQLSHHAAAHEGHGQPPQHHAAASHDQADQGPADSAEPPLAMGKFKCSACATCCLGMGLPSTALVFAATEAGGTVERGMPAGRVVFVTGGPERPPRTFLA